MDAVRPRHIFSEGRCDRLHVVGPAAFHGEGMSTAHLIGIRALLRSVRVSSLFGTGSIGFRVLCVLLDLGQHGRP